jgi:hypothetical protein
VPSSLGRGAQTEGQGVHVVMADGGMDVSANYNAQEIFNKQLLLCQAACALAVLRPGGHFVVKAFDLFTPFSAGLVYVLHRFFAGVSVFKPHTSRPANSERYIVARDLHAAGGAAAAAYLLSLNDRMAAFEATTRAARSLAQAVIDPGRTLDLTHVAPPEVMGPAFMAALAASNTALARKQSAALRKLHNCLRVRPAEPRARAAAGRMHL